MEQAYWMSKKKEYVSEMIATTKDRFVQGLKTLYNSVKGQSEPKYTLRDFQLCLRDTPRWSREKQLEMAEPFKFIPHLAALLQNISHLNEKLYEGCLLEDSCATDVVVFVHTCYVTLARELFNKVHIMHDDVSAMTKRDHMALLEKIVVGGIKQTLRRQVDFERVNEVTAAAAAPAAQQQEGGAAEDHAPSPVNIEDEDEPVVINDMDEQSEPMVEEEDDEENIVIQAEDKEKVDSGSESCEVIDEEDTADFDTHTKHPVPLNEPYKPSLKLKAFLELRKRKDRNKARAFAFEHAP